MTRTPSGVRRLERPVVVWDADAGPSPNVYFPVYEGAGLFDSREFGFLYTPENEAALRRKYRRGTLPDGWTRMKAHWYLVED